METALAIGPLLVVSANKQVRIRAFIQVCPFACD
jgi:hypothetical protein